MPPVKPNAENTTPVVEATTDAPEGTEEQDEQPTVSTDGKWNIVKLRAGRGKTKKESTVRHAVSLAVIIEALGGEDALVKIFNRAQHEAAKDAILDDEKFDPDTFLIQPPAVAVKVKAVDKNKLRDAMFAALARGETLTPERMKELAKELGLDPGMI